MITRCGEVSIAMTREFNKQLRIGIAGYGVVGKRRKLGIDQQSLVELVAVCDRELPRSIQESNNVIYCQDYNELLANSLDAVFVCLPNYLAAEVTIAALERGCHVFCEKPPARSLEELIRVRSVEREKPELKLMYGFNHRYHSSVQEALRIIRSGELGEVINIRGVYGKSQLVTFDQDDWRTQRAKAGGGVLLDQGIHMVDLVRLFAGEFSEVYSFVSNDFWGYDVEDNAYVLMKSEDGVVAMINSSATQWRHRFQLDVNLEKGSLILGGILSGSKSYGAETLTIVSANPEYDHGDPEEKVYRYTHDPSWNTEVRDFVRCILEDRKPSHGSSLDAFETMRLVYQIYYSDPIWREQFDIPPPNGKRLDG